MAVHSVSAARPAPPDAASSTYRTAASISGDRNRSGPGACDRLRAAPRRRPARGPGPGRSGARRSSARAAVSSSIATTRVNPSTDRRNLRAAAQPMETWSSCMAEDGMESTLAGTARRFNSETIPAWVYWAIMWPESTPGSCARNAGRPADRARSSIRSVRRSLIEARSAAAIARKSST